jgi:hypothetical protein
MNRLKVMFLGALLTALSIPAALAQVSLPHSFSPNTPISASQMMDNLMAIVNGLNTGVIARNRIALGSPNSVIINDAAGNLSSVTIPANRLVATNAFGALTSLGCPAGYTLTFNGAGDYSCAPPSAAGLSNNGNSFAAPINVGANDSQPVNLITNSIPRLTVNASGFVGVQNTAPEALLDVAGFGGILIPRLTVVQRDALAPQLGLLIYNTSTSAFNYHNGTTWVELSANALPITGGLMNGNIFMNGFRVSNLGPPIALSDAATKQYVDEQSGPWITSGVDTFLPSGRLGIGGPPHPAAALDINGNTGVLLPRMSSLSRDMIPIPPAGLLLYNMDTDRLNMMTNSGWKEVAVTNSGGLFSALWTGPSTINCQDTFQPYPSAGFVTSTLTTEFPTPNFDPLNGGEFVVPSTGMYQIDIEVATNPAVEIENVHLALNITNSPMLNRYYRGQGLFHTVKRLHMGERVKLWVSCYTGNPSDTVAVFNPNFIFTIRKL